MIIAAEGKYGMGSWAVLFITAWVTMIGVKSFRNVVLIFLWFSWALRSAVVLRFLLFVIWKWLGSITKSHVSWMDFFLFGSSSILIRCWWIISGLGCNTSESNIRVSIFGFKDRLILLKFNSICCTKYAAPIFGISKFDVRRS